MHDLRLVIETSPVANSSLEHNREELYVRIRVDVILVDLSNVVVAQALLLLCIECNSMVVVCCNAILIESNGECYGILCIFSCRDEIHMICLTRTCTCCEIYRSLFCIICESNYEILVSCVNGPLSICSGRSDRTLLVSVGNLYVFNGKLSSSSIGECVLECELHASKLVSEVKLNCSRSSSDFCTDCFFLCLNIEEVSCGIVRECDSTAILGSYEFNTLFASLRSDSLEVVSFASLLILQR